jgi:hypothetical protein
VSRLAGGGAGADGSSEAGSCLAVRAPVVRLRFQMRGRRQGALEPARPRSRTPLVNPPSNEGLVVEDHELSAQLATLHNQLETVALGPPPRHMVRGPGQGC